MRLVHTADWHLGDRLGRIDRTDDLRRAIEHVAGICRLERADVLIVAGDLFSELARPDGLRDAIRHLQATFEPFLCGGGTILAVTGNHDNENFCQTLRHAMTLAAPQAMAFGTLATSGRLYLVSEPALLRLADPGGGLVQFVLMPYPTPAHYLTNELLQRYGSLAEKNQRLLAAFKARLRQIRGDASFDSMLPSVLVGHLSVTGAALSTPFRVSEGQDIVLDDATFASGFAYVALGHIHKGQSIGGHETVRYSGSVDRMDLGESADCKSVVALDLGSDGASHIRTIPLETTPIYEVQILDPTTELPTLTTRFPDHATALVNLHVRYTAGVESLEAILGQLDAIFPRWYSRDWTEARDLGPTLTLANAPPSRGFAETVREYLTSELANHDDGDREAVLARADDLLTEGDAV
ncbi:MAG: exonuclease subunit SbcD [Gemmataceae bacterium]